MADTGDGGIFNPTPPTPVISYVVDALRRRVEPIPSQFLYAAGLTTDEIYKIRTGAPITWAEYTSLNLKVFQAESLYRQSMISSNQPTNQPVQPPPTGTSNIPTWMILMFGMAIFLVVIVLLLRRT